MEKEQFLVMFGCKCRGVKFYDLRSFVARWGANVKLVRAPSNVHDTNCVAAWVTDGRTSRWLQLGHVAREAAKWLHPLLQPQYRVTRLVGYLEVCRVP